MISMQEIDLESGKIIGERRALWSGTDAHFLEAPHVYRIGGYYYLLVAQGGTFFTHMANIARSQNLWGPYEGCPHNPILTNMCDPTWQVQCAGHADLFDDPQGNWWAVHLGIRLARRTMTHLGRETFLTPVIWENGWPVCGHERKAMLQEDGPLTMPQQSVAPFIADMSRTTWEPEWIFLRCPDMAAHQRVPGSMLLKPSTLTLHDQTPTFAGLRPLDFNCVTETAFDFVPEHPGDEAGLAVRLDKQFHITCTVGHAQEGKTLTLMVQAEDICHTVSQCVIPDGDVILRMTADKEKYVFAYAVGEAFFRLGQVSTRFVSTEVMGRCFTGTVIGLYATCAKQTNAIMRVHSFKMNK